MRRIGDRDENEERDRARRGRLRIEDRVQLLQTIEDCSMEVDINEQMAHLQIMDGSLEAPITIDYQPDPTVRMRGKPYPGGIKFTNEEITTQPPTQFTFDGNQVLKQLLKHFEEIFDLANGDPDLNAVYHAGRAFINTNYPALNGNIKGIDAVLKSILTKVKRALTADKKLRERRVELESFLTDSFKDFVDRERDEILQMDIVELQQMVKALTSLLTLCEKQLDIHGCKHRSLVIAKRIFQFTDEGLNTSLENVKKEFGEEAEA